MASAAAESASQSQRAPSVFSGHDNQQGGASVSEGTTTTTTTVDTSSSAAPPSVGLPARRTTTRPALADSTTSPGNPQRPLLPAPGNNEVVVLALLAYNVTVLIGIIPELARMVSDFSAAARVAYGVLAMAAAASLPVSFMAAVTSHAAASAFCAKLGAIACSDLLLVAISTSFGRWGRLAAAPSAAVVTTVMAALWIRQGNSNGALWGRIVRLLVAPSPEPGRPGGEDEDDMTDETDITGEDAGHHRQRVSNDDSPTALLSGSGEA